MIFLLAGFPNFAFIPPHFCVLHIQSSIFHKIGCTKKRIEFYISLFLFFCDLSISLSLTFFSLCRLNLTQQTQKGVLSQFAIVHTRNEHIERKRKNTI